MKNTKITCRAWEIFSSIWPMWWKKLEPVMWMYLHLQPNPKPYPLLMVFNCQRQNFNPRSKIYRNLREMLRANFFQTSISSKSLGETHQDRRSSFRMSRYWFPFRKTKWTQSIPERWESTRAHAREAKALWMEESLFVYWEKSLKTMLPILD